MWWFFVIFMHFSPEMTFEWWMDVPERLHKCQWHTSLMASRDTPISFSRKWMSSSGEMKVKSFSWQVFACVFLFKKRDWRSITFGWKKGTLGHSVVVYGSHFFASFLTKEANYLIWTMFTLAYIRCDERRRKQKRNFFLRNNIIKYGNCIVTMIVDVQK